MATRMLQRRGTVSQWNTINPVLGLGEIGVATYTDGSHVIKVGNGTTPWSDLRINRDITRVDNRIDEVILANAIEIGEPFVWDASVTYPPMRLVTNESQDAVYISLEETTGDDPSLGGPWRLQPMTTDPRIDVNGTLTEALNNTTSVSVKLHGAVGDGLTDDLPAIESAIAKAVEVDGPRSIYLPAGTYLITAAINLPSNFTLHGAGVGASTIILDDAVNDNVVSNQNHGNLGNSHITIRDLTLDGNRLGQTDSSTTGPILSGIALCNVSDSKIVRVEIRSVTKHGVDLTNRDAYDPNEGPGCDRITVIDCVASDFGDDGFTIHNSRDIKFKGCTALDGAATWTHNSNGFEADDGAVRVDFVGCTTINCNDGFEAKGHSNTAAAKDVVFSGCYAIECTKAFDIGNASGGMDFGSKVTITGCISISCNRFVDISRYTDVIVVGCAAYDILDETASSPVWIRGGSTRISISNVIFKNLHVVSASLHGIIRMQADTSDPITDISINNCIIENCSSPRGGIVLQAEISDVVAVSIIGNVINGSGILDAGIRVLSGAGKTRDCVVNSNLIRNCDRSGLWWEGDSSLIVGNNLIDNGASEPRHFRLVSGASENTVQGNKIRGAGTDNSIWISSSAVNNWVTNNDLRDSYTIEAIRDDGTGTITTAGNQV